MTNNKVKDIRIEHFNEYFIKDISEIPDPHFILLKRNIIKYWIEDVMDEIFDHWGNNETLYIPMLKLFYQDTNDLTLLKNHFSDTSSYTKIQYKTFILEDTTKIMFRNPRKLFHPKTSIFTFVAEDRKSVV